MHAWGRDSEKSLNVRFGRRATIHEAIVMDVGQELALTAVGAGDIEECNVLSVTSCIA